jgi:transcriptional regulator with XRE-family HTH domain
VPATRVVALRIDEFDRLTTARGWDSDAKRSAAMGFAQSTLSRVRTGEYEPSARFIHKVLTTLKAPYDALFEARDESAQPEQAVA